MVQNKYTQRFLARLVIEAKTPMAVGSGEQNIMTDALIARDANNLPYIPGTAIAGIMRHAIGEEKSKTFFGIQDHQKPEESRGSDIIFTSAQMLGENGEVIDGLQNIVFSGAFYSKFENLSIRQHCRINSKGTASDGGKFDEQVVYKGTRFCFEIEMVSEGENVTEFENVLKEINSNTIRVGSGTRSGFGEIEVICCKYAKLDLTKSDQLNAYLEKSSSLSDDSFWKSDYAQTYDQKNNPDRCVKFELKLKPDDFFLFGSGLGSEDADITPVTESFIEWKEGKPTFVGNNILIPATSVKGAIAHRVAFHYNKLCNIWADRVENPEEHTGKNNNAVKTLFGSEGKREGNRMKGQLRGNVIVSDCIQKCDIKKKLLNHVSIDRFTGGAIDGALYSEEVIYGKENAFVFTMQVDKNVLESDESIKKAFINTLNDICTGMLPLGGGVNRGHGCFTGEIFENNNKLNIEYYV
jgi:CRISPR/Cas system CSM-associated protein Csm3 (group 7 of RAMP superfamily)